MTDLAELCLKEKDLTDYRGAMCLAVMEDGKGELLIGGPLT